MKTPSQGSVTNSHRQIVAAVVTSLGENSDVMPVDGHELAGGISPVLQGLGKAIITRNMEVDAFYRGYIREIQ